jgi:hypothetical protein
MTDGDFVAVGPLITNEAVKAIPPGPGMGQTKVPFGFCAKC